MKLGLILLISITGILLTISLPHAYSQLVSDNKYLLQATGFVVGTQTIQSSEIDLQFSTGSLNNGNTPITLENGLVSISGNNYLNSGTWTSTLLRNGQFIVVTGDAQNSIGNTIHVNIFGRLVQTSQEGSVYHFTGKITGTTEPFQVAYSAKITSTVSSTSPTQTPTPPTQTSTSQNQGNTVQVSIVSGSSNPLNQNYFSPSSIQITPGTTIVWTNNDSVPHQIESGVIATSKINVKASFSPDGQITSPVLAPGQTFQYTVNNVGTITFYDPSYLWMSGVITSKSEVTTQVKTTQISILPGASTMNTGQTVSPPSLQITPGTTIVWTNNDSVPHALLSGILSTTTQGQKGTANPIANAPSFQPDGQIKSGRILPGQTFQYTMNRIGTITFYDPSYTWINGVISSIPQTSTQSKPIQISIQPGSYQPQGSASQQNQLYTNHYYLPTDLQIIPGTTIVWTNNDTVSHRVLSGISTQRPDNPFTPDGKFDSGPLVPGQSFQFTINGVGIIRFYDPSYTWMNGVIISIPPSSSSHTIAAPSHNPGLH
ncbi:MAG TPA: plastocyanin/azurin family copper-binding protein [Nitrosopumilaceae archaeon]|nr:plastocyanin/azurin family copper-binding protein [Nitrosopumilaceae archaeon]